MKIRSSVMVRFLPEIYSLRSLPLTIVG